MAREQGDFGPGGGIVEPDADAAAHRYPRAVGRIGHRAVATTDAIRPAVGIDRGVWLPRLNGYQGELFSRVGFIVTNMSAKPEGVVHFYHGRGTVEQWIKEGTYALHWTRLSGKRFICNQVRLGLFVLAYNLGNFLRRLVLPRKIKHGFLRSLLVKLIKIGAKVVRHNRYTTFHMAAVAIDQTLFAEILSRIKRLRCSLFRTSLFKVKRWIPVSNR